MSDADKQSRLKTQTTTTQNEYYDQVVVFTRGIINKSFENLTNLYPQTKTLDFEDEDVGSIKGDLLPTQIYIATPDVQIIKIGYQIRFKNGRLKSPSGKLNQDLTDWVLTVKVELGEQKIDSNTPKGQAQFVSDNFDIPPGDYSVARLYASLTDADWGHFVLDESYFGKDPNTGKPITFDEWDKANPGAKVKLSALLGGWADDMSRQGLNTLGVKVTIPSEQQQNPLIPTYPPTNSVHQGFQYRNEATPPDIAADYNSLLYGEQVLDHTPPGAQQIGNWGNWCYPSEGPSPGIDGTFALSSQVFVGTFLGPHFRPLNQTSEMTLYAPQFSEDGNQSSTTWNFDVGYNPNHTSPDDDYFQPVFDTNQTRYIWSKDSTINSGIHYYNNGLRAYFNTSTSTSVVYAWTPGGNSLNISATINYGYDSEYSMNDDMSNPTGWLKDTYVATWSFSILLSTDGQGRLSLEIDDPSGSQDPGDIAVSISQTQHDGYGVTTPANQSDHIQLGIQEKLRSTVSLVEKNLAKMFKTSGKFTYPGNGELSFSNPTFNNHGDVLTEIAYKPLQPGDKVKVPAPDDGDELEQYPPATQAKFGHWAGHKLPEEALRRKKR